MCNVCGAIFRRIKEVIEEIPETSEPSDDCSDEVSKDVAGRLVNGPVRPPQDKREEDSLSADVRKFRRIQLINTSIALSLAHMPSPRYPNTDDRVVREVGFMRDPVTTVSRPLNTEESWAAYYFETHARQCRYCHEPYEVYRNDEQLCESGHGLAQDVGAFLYTRAGEIFSTCEEGDKLVQVELPMGHVQVRNLLKAIEHSLRSEHAVQQFISFDRTQ
ncbi:hypothetical protein SLS60_002812 [Paraconiothyrium brasiliense]|uniref:Uncharacterized protein n=1 Tax=Paraconiothyrium brasiliense TaxID=300254 RepID=A0ABR3RUV4_9PLEO